MLEGLVRKDKAPVVFPGSCSARGGSHVAIKRSREPGEGKEPTPVVTNLHISTGLHPQTPPRKAAMSAPGQLEFVANRVQ